VSVDAGFSCPNIDGKISDKGCIYCDNEAFSFQARSKKNFPLKKQIEEGIGAARKRFKAEKFIVYFQAHTNTYAPVKTLKENYDTIRGFKDIVGLSIATRPDCINEEILDLVESFAQDYEVWFEYGLQSIHNKTLKAINRGHTYEDFLKAFEATRRRRIKVCSHVIIGLPGETEEMILKTAEAMAGLKVDGIKIHPLHVVKGTPLEELFRREEYTPLELDEYIRLLKGFLERLWPETVIQRLSAFCPDDLLIAPKWVSHRNIVETRL